jgi:hypothetical protein
VDAYLGVVGNFHACLSCVICLSMAVAYLHCQFSQVFPGGSATL